MQLATTGGLPWDLHSLADRPHAQLDGVRAVNVAGNFVFDAATHRDFLGASLGTGR